MLRPPKVVSLGHAISDKFLVVTGRCHDLNDDCGGTKDYEICAPGSFVVIVSSDKSQQMDSECEVRTSSDGHTFSPYPEFLRTALSALNTTLESY